MSLKGAQSINNKSAPLRRWLYHYGRSLARRKNGMKRRLNKEAAGTHGVPFKAVSE